MIINFHDDEDKTQAIKISPNQTIEELKLRYSEDIYDDFDLYYNGKLLNKDRLINEYNITSYSTIEIIKKLNGGVKMIEFVDVTKDSQIKKLNSYDKNFKCPWRIVRCGLNLEGKCSNKICIAYNKTVIINKNFGKFDLVKEQKEIHCPMCEKNVEVKTCGFSGCSYCISGKKYDKGKLTVIDFGDWNEVKKKCYNRFEPRTTENVYWESLSFYTKELLF